MQPARLPDTERERLAVLRAYEILDTPPEQAIDEMTSLPSGNRADEFRDATSCEVSLECTSLGGDTGVELPTQFPRNRKIDNGSQSRERGGE